MTFAAYACVGCGVCIHVLECKYDTKAYGSMDELQEEMGTMKRIASFMLAGVIAVSVALAGCGGAAPATSQSGTEKDASAAASTQRVVGGWQMFDGTTPAYTDEEKAAFDKAVGSVDGVSYELVRVLGTQVVSGVNYACLARGTTATAEPATSWYVLAVYRDLDGNASLTSAKPIDLANPLATDEASSANIVGGWEIRNPDNSVLEPKEAADAFNKAAESYTDVTLSPIATLGSQVVSGTNYLVLCQGTPATEGARPQLYLATVYADLHGGAQITDVRGFDLLGYMN